MDTHMLINRESAAAYLESLDDSVIGSIMDRINTLILMKWKYPVSHRLAADFDLRFVAEVMVDFFSDRELVKKILDGERPGAWE